MKTQLTIQTEKNQSFQLLVEIESREITDIEILGYWMENNQVVFGKRQLIISSLIKKDQFLLLADDISYILEESGVTNIQINVKQKGIYLNHQQQPSFKLSA